MGLGKGRVHRLSKRLVKCARNFLDFHRPTPSVQEILTDLVCSTGISLSAGEGQRNLLAV